MTRLRSMKKAYEYLREQEPETILKFNTFKRLILSERFPSVSCNKCRYVDLDDIDKFLSGELKIKEPVIPEKPKGIRPVNEKERMVDFIRKVRE